MNGECFVMKIFCSTERMYRKMSILQQHWYITQKKGQTGCEYHKKYS
jgi:hypothetical protein